MCAWRTPYLRARGSDSKRTAPACDWMMMQSSCFSQQTKLLDQMASPATDHSRSLQPSLPRLSSVRTKGVLLEVLEPSYVNA